jgi:hypothetical protein
MGKYSTSNFWTSRRRSERPHPIWRGIGCILMILVPIISFAFAELTLQLPLAQQYVPYQLMGYPVMPAALWKNEFLAPILAFLQSQQNLYAVVIFFLFYTLVIGAFVSIINAYLYKTVGPPQYGPQDAPPPKVKVKPYKR